MARELAISMEHGMRNHQQISVHNKTLVLASVNSSQYPSITSSAECSTTNYIQKTASQFPAFNCLNWGHQVPEKNVFHVANNAITEDYEITSQKVAENLANKEMARSKTRKK